MLSRFFIDRPIFAWVIAIIIMIAGGLSIATLPVRQYPAIAPPTVGINVNYPGASAQTVQPRRPKVLVAASTHSMRPSSSSHSSPSSFGLIFVAWKIRSSRRCPLTFTRWPTR